MMHGLFVVLPTPFTASGEVDLASFEQLVEEQIQADVDGLVICGTTGEAPTLSPEEQRSLIEKTVSVTNGQMPVIVGTGTNDTHKTVFFTQQAKDAGANGCLVILPYYNRPSFPGVVAHFKEIAKVGLPIVIYHHPGRTGLRLQASQLTELCQIPEVVGIKETSADLDLLTDLVSLTSKPIFTGDDSLTLVSMAAGGAGVFSVVGNLIPREWKQMIDLMQQGQLIEAREIFMRFLPLCRALSLESNPICIKYALSVLGKCLPHMRLPLIEPQEATKKKIAETLAKALLLSEIKSELGEVKR